MEAAKGINSEIATEVTEEVKEATAEVVEEAPFLASWEKLGPIVLFYAGSFHATRFEAFFVTKGPSRKEAA